MADLQSILTATLNAVQAINKVGQTYLQVQGATNLANITSATVVLNGAGRAAQVSVTHVGNSTGMLYDSNSLTLLTRPIYVIANTTGIQVVNMPVGYGIVAVPAGNMTLAISYSPIVT